MAGEGTTGNQPGDPGKDVVSKAEYEAKVAELTKLQQEHEDMRLEVFSPEYMAYLDQKEKGGKDTTVPPKEEKPDISKMTPEQIYQRAKDDAKSELKKDIEDAKMAAVDTVGKETRAREVAAFSRSHADFETFRPVMYGLSLDPKNKDLSLEELYNASKDYVKRNAGPSEEEKKRQAQMSTEKPGGDNASFEKYKKMSAEETAKESLQEVKDKLGPIPQS